MQHFLDGRGRHGIEGSLQDEQVDVFMPQGESEVVSQVVPGLVALVEDAPTSFATLTATDMLRGYAVRFTHRRLEVKSRDERCPAGEFGSSRESFILKVVAVAEAQMHRKTLVAVEICATVMVNIENHHTPIGVENPSLRSKTAIDQLGISKFTAWWWGSTEGASAVSPHPLASGESRPQRRGQVPRLAPGELCHVAGDDIERVGDKWTIMIVGVLSQGPIRFNALQRAIPGLSHKMLTVTLRGLERDGLVLRTVYPSIPPRVEYALTEQGTSLQGPLLVLASWRRTGRATSRVRGRDMMGRWGSRSVVPPQPPLSCKI